MGAFCARRSRVTGGTRSSSVARRGVARIRAAALAGAALLALAPATAQETLTYTYDGRGRLVKTEHSGTANNGVSSCYAYDQADNRTAASVATSTVCTTGSGGGTTPPSFAIGNDSSTEGANVVFTITRSGSSTGSYSLSYATANGTAIAGSDYTAKSGTISFADGVMSKNVAVATTDDTTVESSETFYMDISNPSGGATITDSRGVGTIVDNDSAADPCAGVSFTISSNGAVTEGLDSVFTVTASGSTSNSCSVNYATANGSAVAPGDYTARSGTLTFTSSPGSQTASVATIDDTVVESGETLTMSLSGPTGGAVLGTPSSATATINDNDSAPNQPPVANFDDGGSMSCGDAMIIDVVANDTDPDGNYPLSLVSASGASVISSTEVRVLGTTSGTKSFSYVVQDALNAQATGSGSVTVLAPCQ